MFRRGKKTNENAHTQNINALRYYTIAMKGKRDITVDKSANSNADEKMGIEKNMKEKITHKEQKNRNSLVNESKRSLMNSIMSCNMQGIEAQ